MRSFCVLCASLLIGGCGADISDKSTTGDKTIPTSTQVGSVAESGNPPPPLEPPPEAVEACATQSAGDACSLTIGGHEISGTCRSGPDPEKPLACAPDAALPKPPDAAINACASHAAGDACSFTFDGHEIDGQCRPGPDPQKPLACAPDSLLPIPPPEAIAACKDREAGDACAFTIDGHDANGQCRPGPDPQKPLACAPATP